MYADRTPAKDKSHHTKSEMISSVPEMSEAGEDFGSKGLTPNLHPEPCDQRSRTPHIDWLEYLVR